MGGIRVVNVPKHAEEKHLKIYFSKPENDGGRIKNIYYPLTNNDAVIIFEKSKAIDHVLKTDHKLLKAELKIQRLPENMIFSSLEAKLGKDVSVLILTTPNLQDQLYDKNIDIIEDDDQTLALRGSWFQLEWAWHMLDCIMQQQAAEGGTRDERDQALTQVAAETASLQQTDYTLDIAESTTDGIDAVSGRLLRDFIGESNQRQRDRPDTSNYLATSKYAGETKSFSKGLKHSSPTVDISDQIDAVFQRSLRDSVRESNQRIKSPTSNDQPSAYSSQELCFTTYIKGIKVSIYHGSILEEETEAIVNAANEELEHNGGIARAIADARGPEINAECREYIRKIGELKTTEAMRTSGGGRIKSANIIHAAGPVWVEQLRDTFIKRLTRTFLNCLKLAETLRLKSISVPAISTGVYGAPLDECVKAYLFAVLLFSQDGRHLLDIRMLSNDAENSVKSIVLMKTLLETGLEDLMSQATALFSTSPSSAQRRDLNIPRGRQERSGSVSRMYRKPDDSGATKSASSRRSSSHSRISDRFTSESRDKLLTYTQGDKKRDSFRSSETTTSYSPRLPSSEFLTSPSPRGNGRTKGYTTERDQTGNSSEILNRKTLFNRSLSSGQTERSKTSKTSKRPSTAGNIRVIFW